MKKSLLLLLPTIILFSCSSNNSPLNNVETIQLKKSPASLTKTFVADLEGKIKGTNQKTGVKLSVSINLPKNFKTKASTDGQPKGETVNIQSYKVYLTTSNTNPQSATHAGNTAFVLNTGSNTITFTNVPVGTWFAAVEAWDGLDATGNNITAPQNYSDGILKLGLSSNSVTVNSDLTLTPQAEVLNVSLQLQNAIGANIDTTVNVNNGTPTGAYGAINQNINVLSFDGTDDYVEIAGGGGINGATQGTIEMRVKWNGTQNCTFFGGLCGAVLGRQKEGVFTNSILGLDSSDPASAKVKWIPKTDTVNIEPILTGTTNIGDNTWHHIAVTYSSTEQKLFIDGILEATVAGYTGFDNDSSIPITIGAWVATPPSFANGKISDVRIWSAIRSQTDIIANKNIRLNGNEAGLVNYWKFDEVSGLIANDLGSLNIDGTLVNNPVWTTSIFP